MIKERVIFKSIKQHVAHKQHTIIIGARQVGKTSLLRLLREELLSREEMVHYLNFENPDLLRPVNTHPDQLLRFLSDKPIPILTSENYLYH
ncbi:MAG: AAA family ATPase [Bacteroidota bacterium]